MERFALARLRTAVDNDEHRRGIDIIFRHSFHGDIDKTLRKSLDEIAKSGDESLETVNLIYACLHVRCDEKTDNELPDNDQLLSILAVVCMDFCDPKYTRNRIKWDDHVAFLEKEGIFERMYRMSLVSFNMLVKKLLPFLENKETTSIFPELVMHCVLRYLAGGSYHDIRTSGGLSVASFYRVVWIGNRCAIIGKFIDNTIPFNSVRCPGYKCMRRPHIGFSDLE